MARKKHDDDHYMSSVKVGPKGQIVIPKEARDMFGIEPGDTLLLMADRKRGIAINRLSVFSAVADAIFGGKAKEIYPEQTEEASRNFASAIREATDEE